jgi:hypothetical protein
MKHPIIENAIETRDVTLAPAALGEIDRLLEMPSNWDESPISFSARIRTLDWQNRIEDLGKTKGAAKAAPSKTNDLCSFVPARQILFLLQSELVDFDPS